MARKRRTAALQNLGTAANELADAASPEFGPQAQDLNEAISALGSTLEGLQNQADLSSKLDEIATQYQDHVATLPQ